MAKNGYKVIDSEMHVNEPIDLWERYIAPEFKDRAPRSAPRYALDFATEIHGLTPRSRVSETNMQMNVNEAAKYEHAIARGFDAEAQIDAMNYEGVDVAVLYPSKGLGVLGFENLEPPLALAIARAYNDWLFDFCQHNPSRLKGAAMLPLHDVPDAIGEARRAVTELGMVALFPGTCPHTDRNWHDPVHDPLWAEVEQLGVIWGIHEPIHGGRNGAAQKRFNVDAVGSMMAHVLGRPLELMMSCTSVICGGVLERFPGLKVAFLEGNCIGYPSCWSEWTSTWNDMPEGATRMPRL